MTPSLLLLFFFSDAVFCPSLSSSPPLHQGKDDGFPVSQVLSFFFFSPFAQHSASFVDFFPFPLFLGWRTAILTGRAAVAFSRLESSFSSELVAFTTVFL